MGLIDNTSSLPYLLNVQGSPTPKLLSILKTHNISISSNPLSPLVLWSHHKNSKEKETVKKLVSMAKNKVEKSQSSSNSFKKSKCYNEMLSFKKGAS